MSVLNQIEEFLEYSLDLSLGRLALSICMLMVVLLLRQVFSKYFVGFIARHASSTETTLDDRIVGIVVPPVRFLFVVVGLWAALSILRLPEGAQALATTVMRSLVAVAVVWGLYRAADLLSETLELAAGRTETDVDDLVVQFIRKSVKVIVVSLGVVVIIQEWGYDVAGLIAGLGLGGLAIALAAQDTAANLIGGLTIMFDHPFTIGDWIETPHVEGTVEEIGLRSTRVRTFANALVTVPNTMMGKDQITNWSRMRKRRITFRLKVTYATSSEQIDECCKRIREMLSSYEAVHPDMIFVYFDAFGEDGPELFLYYFTRTTVWKEYLEARHDINLRIMEILDDMGIQVALPARSVYLESGSGTPLSEQSTEAIVSSGTARDDAQSD